MTDDENGASDSGAADGESTEPSSDDANGIAAAEIKESAPPADICSSVGESSTRKPLALARGPTKSSSATEVSDSNVGMFDDTADSSSVDLSDFKYGMYADLRAMEEKNKDQRPSSDYIERIQTDMDPNERAIFVDWLVQLVGVYVLRSDTIFFSVHYFDRYLSINYLSRLEFQILTLSTLSIAAKYYDSIVLSIDYFILLTEDMFAVQQFLDMERDILKIINHMWETPTVKTFLRRLLDVELGNKDYPSSLTKHMACYLAELSLLEYKCLRFLPSVVASAALFLARCTVNPNISPWNINLRECTKLTATELKECIQLIYDMHFNNKNDINISKIRDKYLRDKYSAVAAIDPPVPIPDSFFCD